MQWQSDATGGLSDGATGRKTLREVEMEKIKSHKELRVYQASIEAAMLVFELTKRFPAEEKYSMVDQMRRSSRSVCANVAEAWRKRRYPAHFVSKLSDSEGEAERRESGSSLPFAAAT